MCHKIFEAWKIFFSNSYLGVLRLFLRVLEVARSRRLGIAGEVSVWQIPENSVNHARVNTAATFWSARFWSARFFLRATLWTGVFLIGKTINDRFSNKKLERNNFAARIWTGVFLIGKTINDRFSNKKLLNSHQ